MIPLILCFLVGLPYGFCSLGRRAAEEEMEAKRYAVGMFFCGFLLTVALAKAGQGWRTGLVAFYCAYALVSAVIHFWSYCLAPRGDPSLFRISEEDMDAEDALLGSIRSACVTALAGTCLYWDLFLRCRC